MSALTRTTAIALAIATLAIWNLPGCAPVPPAPGPGGTGGGVVGAGGDGFVGTGGLVGAGGGLSTGGDGPIGPTGGSPAAGGGPGAGGVPGDTGGGPGAGGAPIGDGSCPPMPELPEPSGLTEVNMKLPDPFTFYDGTPLTHKSQWECRRKEILAMAAKYLYAPVPPEPDMTEGTVSASNVTMNVTAGGNTQSFTATISGTGTAIVLNVGSGVGAPNSKSLAFGSGYQGKVESLFGISGTNINIVNGWMIDRVMDVLEANPGTHDHTKIMVTGCSGCGKGAYLAGVFSRVPLTVIVESGGGGVANLRQAEWFRHGEGNSTWMCQDALPQSIDNLENSGACTPWVTAAAQWLRNDSSKVYNLPFDTHLLLATIAPRALVHFTNNNGTNSWCHLGGTCEALSAWAAQPVWKALGVPELMSFSMYSAGHCQASGNQIAAATNMFDRVFSGNMSANTGVMEIPDNGVQQPVSEWEAMWIDWNMDTVLQ